MTPGSTHNETAHVPVLLREMAAFITPRAGGIYVDGTFGTGGYSIALLEAADCRVIGIDRDPVAIERGSVVANRFPSRLTLIKGHFGDIVTLLAEYGLAMVDGIALDLGVSALQISTPERGFSFQTDGPLDMRMDCSGPTAADIVNTYSESALACILQELGEERKAHQIARALIADRPINSSSHLALIVRRIVTRSRDRLDPATRTFQALRMFVNDEQSELKQVLVCSEHILAPGGCIVVVSFHSLEDRIVKHFLKLRSGHCSHASRHHPEVVVNYIPTFRILTHRAIRPTVSEIISNPRARSARLRAAERTSAPVWPGLR